MLSVKNLTKVYKTKGGVDVRALDGVTLDFPSTGMVFLLGKSGSGKSTLLNVAGGLDMPDSGEVIVKGKSSKSFSQSDFDNYRNTYVGFIFQEYNILNEFNVEQNIALALQLQGKKSDRKAVNELLEKVDLKGMGKRKPNTLSGGQKQRVAIARALIKEPEIIMADEPTGALDSTTGRQVFETLKKLSAEKLVIVVSHDREFAELYGDRIIELKDGKVFSDTVKSYSEPAPLTGNVSEISKGTLRIKDASKLTSEDIKGIMAMLGGRYEEVIISSSDADVAAFKRANKISDDGTKECFVALDPSTVKKGEYDGKNTKFVKSHMPASRAFKMGASGLKSKPIRLLFTVLLSVLSFAMFGILSTMMMYDPIYSVSTALQNNEYNTATLQKYYTYTNKSIVIYPDGEQQVSEYESESITRFGEKEIEALSDGSDNMDFAGVFNYQNYGSLISYSQNIGSSKNSSFYNNFSVFGFSDCGQEYLERNNMPLTGTYPVGSDEVAVSSFVYDAISENGYKSSSGDVVEINEPSDLIGKELNLTSNDSYRLTITGVFEADPGSKFEVLKDSNANSDSQPGQNTMSQEELDTLEAQFKDMRDYSFCSMLCVSDEFYQAHIDNLDLSGGNYIEYNTYGYGFAIESGEFSSDYIVDEYSSTPYYSLETLRNHKDIFVVVDTEGNAINVDAMSLGKNDIYVYPSFGWEAYAMSRYVTDYDTNETYGDKNPEFFNAAQKLNENKPVTAEELGIVIKSMISDYESFFGSGSLENIFKDTYYAKNYLSETDELNVKGYVLNTKSSWSRSPVISDEFAKEFSRGANSDQPIYKNEIISDYKEPEDAKYNYIITYTDNSYEQAQYMLEEKENGVLYHMTSSVYGSVSSMTYMLDMMKIVFLIAGLVLALLSSLMLFNFISVSISVKKKDIGILRAVGARGSDVFKIFFSEAFIIAMICFILSAVCAGVACMLINSFMLSSAIKFAILNFGLINVAIIFAITIIVSFIGTILPVMFASRKSPVESIRAL